MFGCSPILAGGGLGGGALGSALSVSSQEGRVKGLVSVTDPVAYRISAELTQDGSEVRNLLAWADYFEFGLSAPGTRFPRLLN